MYDRVGVIKNVDWLVEKMNEVIFLLIGMMLGPFFYRSFEHFFDKVFGKEEKEDGCSD